MATRDAAFQESPFVVQVHFCFVGGREVSWTGKARIVYVPCAVETSYAQLCGQS